MKKSFLSVLLVAVLTISCAGCQTARNTEGDISDQNNQIVEGEDDQTIGETNDQTTEDEKVVYQEAYKKVDLVEVDMKWYVENDEVKDLQYSEYTDEIIPGEKYSKYDIIWTYVGEQLYLGQDRGCYYMSKIPNCEDKVLLESWMIGLDYEAPSFRVFDINKKEIIEIYPENVEVDYVVTSADVSADLKDVGFIGSSKVYYYDGEQITKIDQFDDKLDGLNQPVIMIEDNKILVLGYNSNFTKVHCYVYDKLTGELTEREYMHAGSNSNGVSTYELQPDRECRYGTYYQENCLTIIDFLTGKENKTELSKEKIRWVENINEKYFFVLADYAYVIEKATGRIVGQTEHEMTPSDEGERFTVMLVPSDEDLYFYLHQHSCEEAGIYKIDIQEGSSVG